MSKTLIVSGTNRKGALSQIVAKKYFELYQQNSAAEVQFFSLENLPSDIAFAETYGKRSPEFESLIEKYFIWADKFVFVLPEYNGGMPGILKLMIDSIHPKHFHHKKAALVGVSTGRAGNLRGLDHLNDVLNHIRINVLWDKIPISSVDKLIVDSELQDFATLEVLTKQMIAFDAF
jgi:chromate reductase, NAD(P)H dehydrogenase (quinone)